MKSALKLVQSESTTGVRAVQFSDGSAAKQPFVRMFIPLSEISPGEAKGLILGGAWAEVCPPKLEDSPSGSQPSTPKGENGCPPGQCPFPDGQGGWVCKPCPQPCPY